MAAKKEWHQPALEVLDVNQTAASTHNGPKTDEAYIEGQWNTDPRFTS